MIHSYTSCFFVFFLFYCMCRYLRIWKRQKGLICTGDFMSSFCVGFDMRSLYNNIQSHTYWFEYTYNSHCFDCCHWAAAWVIVSTEETDATVNCKHRLKCFITATHRTSLISPVSDASRGRRSSSKLKLLQSSFHSWGSVQRNVHVTTECRNTEQKKPCNIRTSLVVLTWDMSGLPPWWRSAGWSDPRAGSGPPVSQPPSSSGPSAWSWPGTDRCFHAGPERLTTWHDDHDNMTIFTFIQGCKQMWGIKKKRILHALQYNTAALVILV